MQKLIAQVKQFARDENGITALEYGMLAGLITVLIIASVATIGTTLKNVFSDVAATI
ncbi:Flp family type IVb pilin [Paraburkholderia guartelaensis]|jgi:pilus assembly protein Flp/PilA|uniref:Flp family type IVb pilin n=1 Tax=Paraburkholderia guartelaensis TaxID=2546446 RepID=A0A4R5LHZ5_9BURK|nr:Flp family type IVb pilin [Paraburkholderia guartelaensis]TDG09070.1 Flp family type IVb pilin [Paraburkholderia guartelaensis]